MINIVIPMAGRGSRFAQAGFADPKPLILVRNRPMIQLIIENLRPSMPHRFIFICQQAHVQEYHLQAKLAQWAPGSILIEISGITAGAACTVLTAEKYIDNDLPLMIANSDQFITANINDYLLHLEQSTLNGLIMTMHADHTKWSYVGLENSLVTRVVEKEVISNEATVGIYNFQNGKDFVCAAKEMVANQERVNGEYYVAPVYNKFIKNGGRVGIWNIGSELNGMYGLGTPEDLALFLKQPIAQQLSA